MSERHRIGGSGLSAEVAVEGAELVSLRDASGDELLWQAGPEWPRHAPVLFPIVGRLAADTLRHDGQEYALTQHGFARDSTFRVTEQSDDRIVLRLDDSASSRARFPFPFRLEMIYEADGETLTVTSRIHNPGASVLPCGIGAHPGFRWPLAEGISKEAHVILFDVTEVGASLGVEDGLLGEPRPLPFGGRTLPLSETLFASDALVMPGVASRSLRYAARDETGHEVRAMTISWEGYKDLGIWSKPGGAPFVCIEPWYSMASPVGWDGDFISKPGLLHLAPGETREFLWRVAI